MIELVVVLLGFFCPEPDLPTNAQVSSVLQTGWLSETVYGSSPYEFPTTEPNGELTYKVTVDPLYEDYEDCFAAEVRSILNDPRSWDGVSEAEIGETPNIWITLAAPGDCAVLDLPIRSCARWRDDGSGQIGINVLRWFNGSGNLGLLSERAHIVNHEIGHILGYSHDECGDVMAPYYELDPSCSLVVWPNEANR